MDHQRGGNGGKGSTGTAGSQTSADASVDSISVISGNGGNGGQGLIGGTYNDPSGNGGAGGAGGSANLTLTGTTVTSAGPVLVQSGAKGADGDGTGYAPDDSTHDQGKNGAGGAGGAASFTANTLIAPTINLVKKDGALTFTVANLDVTGGNTTLALDGTAAAGVNIRNVTLDGGNTFTVTSVNNGAAAINNLNVTGTGTVNAASQLFTNVNLAGGSNLTASTLNFSTMNVQGAGATYTGTLDAAGKNLNFYLPTTMLDGDTMLTVTGTAYIGGSSVNVGIAGGSSPLQVGNQVVLIDAATLTGAPANTTANGRGMQGVTLLYEFDILADSDSDKLFATVSSIGVNPQLKSLSEGRVAGHAFLNQGSDLMLGSGMGAMLAATQGTTQSPTQGGFAPFAAGSGGWSRYNTGSHVDVSGASIMTGLAWRQPVNEGKNGSVLAGAFFEAGWGNYDSHNSFSNAASVKGDGDISYYGGGILGRYDFAPAIFMNGSGNFYVDASFRAGHVSTDFSSSDLIDNAGRKADYDSGSAYYGVHAGLGYLWNITESASLDLSTRYIWTRQDSDTVKVLDDPVRFKAIDSQRWRTGARFAYAVNEYIAPYAGAYYDHEFDGKAKASTYGYAIDAPDLTGGTGVGELGFTLKPSQSLPLSFDLGVQGYTGVREGVTGSFQAKWEF